MKDQIFFDLVTKSITKEITYRENEELKSFLYQKKYLEKYQLIKNNWDNLQDNSYFPKTTTKQAFNNLSKRIQKDEYRKQRERTRYFIKFRNIAVVVFIIILFCSFFSIKNYLESDSITNVTWNETTTSLGQKIKMTLSDGTKIILNANSRLKYASDYGKKSRDIYLIGEAYFEVAHNKKIPFVVHAKNIETKVLGTIFNVKAFSEENKVYVSLVKGKVSVSSPNNKENLLYPTEQFVYNTKNKVEMIRKIDIDNITGWKDNFLRFINTPLSKVFAELERNYGIKLRFKNNIHSQKRIRATFKNESIWNIIRIIGIASELRHEVISKDGKVSEVIFYK